MSRTHLIPPPMCNYHTYLKRVVRITERCRAAAEPAQMDITRDSTATNCTPCTSVPAVLTRAPEQAPGGIMCLEVTRGRLHGSGSSDA